jgi:hypothetical protein
MKWLKPIEVKEPGRYLYLHIEDDLNHFSPIVLVEKQTDNGVVLSTKPDIFGCSMQITDFADVFRFLGPIPTPEKED